MMDIRTLLPMHCRYCLIAEFPPLFFLSRICLGGEHRGTSPERMYGSCPKMKLATLRRKVSVLAVTRPRTQILHSWGVITFRDNSGILVTRLFVWVNCF